jgi:hypothetical protein
MGESDTRTSHLIIRIGHLMKQILTMHLKKGFVYLIFLFDTVFQGREWYELHIFVCSFC